NGARPRLALDLRPESGVGAVDEEDARAVSTEREAFLAFVELLAARTVDLLEGLRLGLVLPDREPDEDDLRVDEHGLEAVPVPPALVEDALDEDRAVLVGQRDVLDDVGGETLEELLLLDRLFGEHVAERLVLHDLAGELSLLVDLVPDVRDVLAFLRGLPAV